MPTRTNEDGLLWTPSAPSFTIPYRDCKMVSGLSRVQLKQAYQLRAAVFCRELGWVGHVAQRHEIDEFDQFVHHLGIETQNNISSYLRIHPAGSPWMIDSVFRHVVPPDAALHKAGTCEVSRLAVAREYRGNLKFEGYSLFCRTMQLMYTFCQLNSIHTIFTIVSVPVLRLLQDNGLPFKEADSLSLPSGRDTPVFATLSWPDFLRSNDSRVVHHRPAYLATERDACQILNLSSRKFA